MPKIYNVEQLRTALQKPIERSIKQLGGIVNDYTKEMIKAIVYNPYIPSWYKRRKNKGGFLGSWVHEDFEFKTTIFSDADRMEEHEEGNKRNFIHGSEYYEPSDIRDRLGNYIIEGTSGYLFGTGFWTESRDFWSPTIQYVEKDILQTEIKNVFGKHGIILV